MRSVNVGCGYGALLAVLVAGGCVSYRSAPIDWARENAVWMEKGSLTFASLDEVERVAVIGNAELNEMRLKRANSERVAKATGWWDDPELDIDLLRVIHPTEHPLIGGASLAMTIPLSGVKGLERRTAEAYSAADAADIVAAELETRSEARKTAIRLSAAGETVKLLKEFDRDPRVTGAFAAAEKLVAAGELSRSETASARLRRHQRLHRLREAETAVAESEQALRRLLGVAPKVALDLSCCRDEGALSPADFSDDPLDYTRHPRVRAAVCRLEGGEAALEAEIRRQYPDLKLGPAYSREDGMDRLGIVAGLALPLWNRNRRGIAEAEGARDEARQAAVKVWQEVVREADAARRAVARLQNHPPEPVPSRKASDTLFDAGEMTALEYLGIREEALDLELMESEWRRDLLLAKANGRKWAMESGK